MRQDVPLRGAQWRSFFLRVKILPDRGDTGARHHACQADSGSRFTARSVLPSRPRRPDHPPGAGRQRNRRPRGMRSGSRRSSPRSSGSSRPRRSLPAAASLAAVLVTSGNAVDALPQAYRATRVLSVGDATAERARAAGFIQVLSAAGDAEALAELVIRQQNPRDGTLLLASGRRQGHALAGNAAPGRLSRGPPGGLRGRSRPRPRSRRSRRPARRPGRAPRCSSRPRPRASSSGWCSVPALAETLAGVEAISIGQAAAVALEALPWRDVRVAARPTQDEMLALLR